MEDTDWHITRLYDGLIDNVTVLSTPNHHYLIDVKPRPVGCIAIPRAKHNQSLPDYYL